MKILVPVDGSKHSDKAVAIALDLAKTKGAELNIISAVQGIGGLDDHEISPARRERHESYMEGLAAGVIKKAVDFLAGQGVTPALAQPILASSTIPDAIVDFAESEKMDLIVMGSRGLNASANMRIGNVAAQVAKNSHCSVYLVK